MDYTYLTKVAIDEDGNIARSTTGQIFAFDDAEFAFPLQVTDVAGIARQYVTADERGILQGFTVVDHPKVKWRSGEFVSVLGSFDGMLNAANAAADRAEAAYQLLADFGDTNDTLMHSIINDDASLTHDWLTGRFTPLASFRAWSNPLGPAGSGGSVIRIDETAAPNIPDYTGAVGSRGVIAVGRDALGVATSAPACIAIGENTMSKGNPGEHNLALGGFALTHVNGGHRNIGVGSLAGHFISTGYQNVLMGRDSGHSITTGVQNVGIGYRALATGLAPVGLSGAIENQYTASAGSSRNSVLGTGAFESLAGSDNVGLGAAAATNWGNTYENVVIGSKAAENIGINATEYNKQLLSVSINGSYTQTSTSITVTAIGHGCIVGNKVSIRFQSGQLTTAPQWMTVVSVSGDTFSVVSPRSVTTSGNVLIDGVETNVAVPCVGDNVIIGYGANRYAEFTNGNQVIIGANAGLYATTDKQAIVGVGAGDHVTTGRLSALGAGAGSLTVAGADLTTYTNVTCLGEGSRAAGSNELQLGNSATTAYSYGAVQMRSDERDKADIRDTQFGIDFVRLLRPVDHRWDYRDDYVAIGEDGTVEHLRKDGSKKRNRYHTGFIAQQVKASADMLGLDFGGFQDHSVKGGDDIQTLGTDELVAVLTRALQQVDERVSGLETARG